MHLCLRWFIYWFIYDSSATFLRKSFNFNCWFLAPLFIKTARLLNFQKTSDPRFIKSTSRFSRNRCSGLFLIKRCCQLYQSNHLKLAQCQDHPQMLVSSRDLVRILQCILYFTELHFIEWSAKYSFFEISVFKHFLAFLLLNFWAKWVLPQGAWCPMKILYLYIP